MSGIFLLILFLFKFNPANMTGRESRARGIANPYMPARGGWPAYQNCLARRQRNPDWPMDDWSADADWHERYARPPRWSPLLLSNHFCTRCGRCFHAVSKCRNHPTGVVCRKCGGSHPTNTCNVTPWVLEWLREHEEENRDFHRHMRERQTRLPSSTNRDEPSERRREDGRAGSSSGR